MTAQSRGGDRRALPWILGIVAMVVSLVAANRIFSRSAETASTSLSAQARAAKTSPTNVGLTVKGVVDAPEGIVRVDAPAVATALTVKNVLVEEGAFVEVNDPLIMFDDMPFREKVAQAKASLDEATNLVRVAEAQRDDHPKKIEQQRRAVRVAKIEHKYAQEALLRGRDIFENALNIEKVLDGGVARNLTPQEKDKRRRDNLELLRTEGNVELLEEKVKKEELELARLEAYPAEAEVGRAQANLALCQARLNEAKDAKRACLVTAKVAGVVEQVTANVGMTFGPATRTPALLIVPSGKRVVRAEVEAEFAFKISDQLGKPVLIYDDHSFSITYEGLVTRISPAFLAKRGAGDAFSVGPANKVLECVIEVNDPTPKGKPPLLPGLPVRVGFSR